MDHRDSWQGLFKRIYFQLKREFKSNITISFLAYTLSSGFVVNAELIPRLDVGQYYNDNVNLSPPGMEQDANITELQPGITFEHDGRRIDAHLEYTLQALYFSADKDSDEIYHNAFAQTNITLIPQSSYLDVAVSYSDDFISPDGVIDLDNLSLSGESTGTVTYRISPYIRHQYGNIANAEFRVSQEKVQYENSASAVGTDSKNTMYFIDVASGVAFDDYRWRLNYSSTKFTAENESESTLKSVTIDNSYRLTPKLDFILNLGYDDNEFEQPSESDDPSGAFWSSGFGWTFNRRTQIQATVGERFFGKISSFLINHRTRRSIWNVEYSEEVTTTAHVQQPDLDFGGDTGVGTPVLPEGPSDVLLPGVASVIVVERLTIGANYLTGKTTLNFSVIDETRKYQSLGQEDHTRGANASILWQFKPRTAIRLTGTKYKFKLLGSSQIDYLGQAELAVERSIKRTITGTMGVRVVDRNSSNNLTEYERNLAFVSVNMTF